MPLDLDKFSEIVERYMLDTGRLVRPAEDSDLVEDPVTLEITQTETELYNGKCMVSPMGAANQQDLGGAMSTMTLMYEVGVPLTVDALPNDVFIVTASRDTQLVGKRLRVEGFMPGTFAVARRMSCRMELDITDEG